jgi:sialate O-acetylesterase
MPCKSRCSVILVVLMPLAGLVAAARAQADIRLPKIFADQMVLQRDSLLRVWGWAEPNEALTLTIADTTLAFSADASGAWRVEFPSPPMGGPYELTVKGPTAQVVFKDVWVGEVWVCSGQSNMEWTIGQVMNGWTPERRAAELQRLADTNVRLFKVTPVHAEKPQQDFAHVNSWTTCTAESAENFSAVALYFAAALSKYFNGEGPATAPGSSATPPVPIGLILSAWGGTVCEAWMSPHGFDGSPTLQPLLDYWAAIEQTSNARPSSIHNAMIAPLGSLSIRGAIWYQGEANVGRGAQYAVLFPALIADWRAQFGKPEMPFLFVQLAPFRNGNFPPDALPEVWDAQRRSLEIPATGMVVTTDVGDINDIHPLRKQEVGERLARWAQAVAYGDQSICPSGPIFRAAEVTGSRICVTFDHACKGLASRDGPLTDFLICGPSHEFVPAQATIVGPDAVEVWADEVSEPVAVRFAWSDTAQPNLINSEGLPASPFRSDDFPLSSAGRNN